MSSHPNGSPPPYEYGDERVGPAQPAYSYYPDDQFQHFYRWTSPPGIIKIICGIAVVLCVGIFACVASTLAWDSNTNALAGFGGYGAYGGTYNQGYGGGGYGGGGFGVAQGGSFGGAGSYGNFAYGSYGSQIDPRKAKGFFIAMAIITFILLLAIFIITIGRQSLSRSRRFYLAVIIICAIMAFFVLIATIVYLVAVNPMAQSSGSQQYNQIIMLCAPYQQTATTGTFVNQYLYHYCVVDPQEAIAVVLGFLVTACLIIILVFAVKTRQKMLNYGKDSILWRKVKVIAEPEAPQDVEDWVNNVSAAPDAVVSAYPEKLRGSREYLDDHSTDYDKPPYSDSPAVVEHDDPLYNAAPSVPASSAGRPKKRRPRRTRRADGQEYDTDYNSSGDELDDDDFGSEFPPIANDRERDFYKQEFDRDHQEYKELQAELDGINKRLAEVDQELDELQEGSPQYLDALDEYHSLKDKKRTGDYQVKKRRSKYLKAKLSHIKRMVSDYDRRG